MPTSPASDVLDLSVLQELHEVLDDALFEIVQAFLEGLDGELQALMAACEQDADRLRRCAHSLKGSSANMGARALASLCSEIEKQAHQGQLDACRLRMGELQALALTTQDALRAYMQRA
jgi:HPt (histidine-containing phosphotransfer) domain-containing protein